MLFIFWFLYPPYSHEKEWTVEICVLSSCVDNEDLSRYRKDPLWLLTVGHICLTSGKWSSSLLWIAFEPMNQWATRLSCTFPAAEPPGWPSVTRWQRNHYYWKLALRRRKIGDLEESPDCAHRDAAFTTMQHVGWRVIWCTCKLIKIRFLDPLP